MTVQISPPGRWPRTGLDTVIWDFNGTLLDDVALAVDAVNVVLERRGLQRIDAGRHRRLFGHPIAGYYAALGIDLERQDLASLSEEFHARYLAGVAGCGLVRGARDLLSAFREGGLRQFVLSAAEQSMLHAWVDMHGLTGFFDAVYGLPDKLAATKVARGQALVREHGIDAASTLLIGDTDHDVEVAGALGCAAAAVDVGHQDRARLARTGVAVFASLGQLQAELLTQPGNAPQPKDCGPAGGA